MADNVPITVGDAGKTVATDDVGGVQYQRIKLDLGTDGAAAPALAGAGAVATGVQRMTLASDDPAVVDLAAMEALLITIDTDTGAMVTDLAAIEVLLGTIDTDTGAMVTDLAAIEVLLGTIDTDTGAMVTDLAAIEVLLGTIDADTSNITACNTGAVVISSGTVTTVSTVTSLTQMGGVAITMGEGALDGGCQRVSLATDDDGVAHLATIAGDTTSIDGWTATHASAAPATGAAVMGAGYSAGLPTDIGADADAARICTDRFGRIVRGLMPQNFVAIYNSADASGEGEVVKAKTASRKIYILSLTISVDAEMWVELQDEDSNAITCKHWFKAGGGKTITYPPESPLILNVANKDLEVITEGAGNIGVEVTGYLAV